MAASPPAAAQKASASAEEPRYVFPLELTPFNTLIHWEDGRRSNTIITVYFNLLTQKDVEAVCLLMPRMRDTLINSFQNNPFRVKRGRLDLAGAPERLQGAVNKTLGAEKVAGIKIVYGVGRKKMERSRNCKTFLKEFKKKAKEAKKE